VGVLSYALFPNASRAAFETHGKAILAAIVPKGATVSRHQVGLPAKFASRLGVSDSVPAPRAMDAATRPSDHPPVEQAVITAPQAANAVYVIANVDPTAQTRLPQEQPDHQQLQHPQAMQVHVQQVKLEQNDVRILSAEEINRLIHWGEKFLAQGDVATARRFLERAAEARDPRGTLMLGATYDPVGLKGMGVVGILPELEQAHSWYIRAAEFGSPEASQRLITLAQLAR
jgi:TPR repeat protein